VTKSEWAGFAPTGTFTTSPGRCPQFLRSRLIEERIPDLTEKLGRQDAIIISACAFARNRAEIEARPAKTVGFVDDDPGRRVVQAKPVFRDGRYLDGFPGISWRRVSNGKGCNHGIAVIQDDGEDDDARPMLRAFL
jgi:hypothetical protein